jgi:hypothetical protein
MAGIFTQETMNNLAGPQRKNGRGPGELEHRTGRRFEQYYSQLVADAGAAEFVAPRGKNCQRKFSDQIPTHSVTRSICAHGRADSMRFTNISGATLLL